MDHDTHAAEPRHLASGARSKPSYPLQTYWSQAGTPAELARYSHTHAERLAPWQANSPKIETVVTLEQRGSFRAPEGSGDDRATDLLAHSTARALSDAQAERYFVRALRRLAQKDPEAAGLLGQGLAAETGFVWFGAALAAFDRAVSSYQGASENAGRLLIADDSAAMPGAGEDLAAFRALGDVHDAIDRMARAEELLVTMPPGRSGPRTALINDRMTGDPLAALEFGKNTVGLRFEPAGLKLMKPAKSQYLFKLSGERDRREFHKFIGAFGQRMQLTLQRRNTRLGLAPAARAPKPLAPLASFEREAKRHSTEVAGERLQGLAKKLDRKLEATDAASNAPRTQRRRVRADAELAL